MTGARADAPGPAGPAAEDSRPVSEASARARRAGVVLTAVLLVATAQVWLTPFTAVGRQGYPFGCGSLAHPTPTVLADRICAVQSEAHAVRALLLLVAAGAAAGVAATLAPRAPAWTAGVLAAVPVLAAGLALLLSPLQVQGTDGGAMACGRPVAPVTDRFAAGLCADLPESRLGAGAALAVVAVLLGAGIPWTLGRQARPSGPGTAGTP